MERVEPIRLVFDENTPEEKEYVIEFNRKTCADAEKGGFSAEKVETEILTQIPLLFFYGLKMHHPDIKKSESDKLLFDDLGGISKELIERLIELYGSPYKTLFNETGKPKNPRMTVRL